MGMSESLSKRRMGVVVNYTFLLLSLMLSIEGHWLGWSDVKIVGFCLSVVLVIATFYPVHVRTGLWRLAHAKVDSLDEREIQQTLESLRGAYIVFTIVSLSIILTLVIIGLGSQTLQLAVFWILLYLAHTLPSSILAWTTNRIPAQSEE